MDLDEYERRVRATLDQARETLAAIEMEVRERGERPPLMEASRAYAQYCMAARDFLIGLQQRRPMPRRFADRARAVAAEVAPREARMAPVEARPSAGELQSLAEDVEQIPERF